MPDCKFAGIRARLLAGTLGVGTCVWCGAASAEAATKTWTPFLGSTDWQLGLNWNPGGVPGASDDVVIALTNSQVVLADDTTLVDSILLTNGADLATNGHTLNVNDNNVGTVTLGNGTHLSRLEVDSGPAKSADIDRLVINDSGQLDMDGGLIQIDNLLDVNAGGEVVGRGTIELVGTGFDGRAAILDGNVIVDPAQTLTIRSTGGGTVDLDGTAANGLLGVTNAATLRIDAALADTVGSNIVLNHGALLEVTQAWELDGKLEIQGLLSGNFTTGTIAGADWTVSGTVEINDVAQIVVDAPVHFSNPTIVLDDDGGTSSPVAELRLAAPATFDGGSYQGDGVLRITDGARITGDTSFGATVRFNSPSPSTVDLRVDADTNVVFFADDNSGLTDARIVLEKNSVLGTLQPWRNDSSISLADGASIRFGALSLEGILYVGSGEAEITAPFELGRGILNIINGGADATLRIESPTQYFNQIQVLGDLRIVHNDDVDIRSGLTTVDPLLLEFAGSDNASVTLNVHANFSSANTTLASGANSAATANVHSFWNVTESLFVGGSTTAPGGAAAIRVTGGSLSNLVVADQLKVYSSATLEIDHGRVTTEFLIMDPGATLSLIDGRLTVDGGAAVLPGSSFVFGGGPGDDPEFHIVDGADVPVTFAWHIASGADTSGRTEVVGLNPLNQPSTLRNTAGGGGADLVVGVSGAGALRVAQGGLADFSDDVVLGAESTGIGTVEVDGVNGGVRSTIRTRGGGASVIAVGLAGSGTLDITDGALVTSAGDVFLADRPGSSGQVHLFRTAIPDNGGLSAELIAADDVVVGGGFDDGGAGTLLVEDGSRVAAGDVFRVRNAQSRLEIFGGGEVSAGRFFHIDGGNVQLHNGKVSITAAGTRVNQQLLIGTGPAGSAPMQWIMESTASGSLGEVQVGGNGVLQVDGQASVGELAIDSGGKLLVAGRVDIGQLRDGAGTLEFAAGTLAVTRAQTDAVAYSTLIHDQATFEIPTGVALTLNGTITGSPADGADVLTKTGAGILTLAAANDFAGSTDVLAGTLLANNEIGSATGAGTVRVAADARLGGTGSVGDVVALAASTLAPGTGVGTLSLNSLDLQADSALQIELGGLAVGIQYDQLHVETQADLDGSLLEIVLVDGFQPRLGDLFTILRTAGIRSGQFAAVGGITLPGDLKFEVLYDPQNVMLEVVSNAGVEGDFDVDGDVDGGDFLTWQRGESPTPISSTDLADWQVNFGSPLSITASSTAVPEQASAVLLLFAAACQSVRRRRAN